jgi:hypothetical protein
VLSLESIRSGIRQRLIDLGAEDLGNPAESCLLQDGAYCGRRFTLGGFQAVWFFEEDQVKFYGARGEMMSSERIEQLPCMPVAGPKFAPARAA